MMNTLTKKQEERIGDIVWAKLPPYPFWPALVWDPRREYLNPNVRAEAATRNCKNLHIVYFYGSGEFGFILDKNIKDLSDETAGKSKSGRISKDIALALAEAKEACKLTKEERIRSIRNSSAGPPGSQADNEEELDDERDSKSSEEKSSSSEESKKKMKKTYRKEKSHDRVSESEPAENKSSKTADVSKKESPVKSTDAKDSKANSASSLSNNKREIQTKMISPKNEVVVKDDTKKKFKSDKDRTKKRRIKFIMSDSDSDHDAVISKAKVEPNIVPVAVPAVETADCGVQEEKLQTVEEEELTTINIMDSAKTEEKNGKDFVSKKRPLSPDPTSSMSEKPLKKKNNSSRSKSKAVLKREAEEAAAEARRKRIEEMKKSNEPIYKQMSREAAAKKKTAMTEELQKEAKEEEKVPRLPLSKGLAPVSKAARQRRSDVLRMLQKIQQDKIGEKEQAEASSPEAEAELLRSVSRKRTFDAIERFVQSRYTSMRIERALFRNHSEAYPGEDVSGEQGRSYRLNARRVIATVDPDFNPSKGSTLSTSLRDGSLRPEDFIAKIEEHCFEL